MTMCTDPGVPASIYQRYSRFHDYKIQTDTDKSEQIEDGSDLKTDGDEESGSKSLRSRKPGATQ